VASLLSISSGGVMLVSLMTVVVVVSSVRMRNGR
jgi:hypothetical protein